VVDPEEACDLFTYLPFDCSVDEAYGHLVNTLIRRKRPGVEDTTDLLERVHTYNANPNADIVEETLGEVMESIEETMTKGPVGKKARSVGGVEKLPSRTKKRKK